MAGEEWRARLLGGGVSNVVLLAESGSGRRWVFKQALGRLRVAEEWLADIAGRWPMYIVGALAIAAFWFAIPAPNVADPLVHRAARRTGLQYGLVQSLLLVAVTAATTALFRGSG